MSIIVDFQAIMLANMHAQVGLHQMSDVEPDMLRHMILNSLRAYRRRFKKDYGEPIIACEEHSWRYDVFPYYKCRRKKNKDEKIDWAKVFDTFRLVRSELKEFFPYPVIEAEGAEADDVIGHLCRKLGNSSGMNYGAQHVIVSRDKDFAQLHKYKNIKQFDPIDKKWITVETASKGKLRTANEFLLDQIIKGDSVDDIPNILSDDDTYAIEEKRSQVMSAKRLEALTKRFAGFTDNENKIDPVAERFKRNQMLIDLDSTPTKVQAAIDEAYDQQQGKNRSKLFGYFVSRRLRGLMENITEF